MILGCLQLTSSLRPFSSYRLLLMLPMPRVRCTAALLKHSRAQASSSLYLTHPHLMHGGRGQSALPALPADLCLLLLRRGMHRPSLIAAGPQAHSCLQVFGDIHRTLAPTRAGPPCWEPQLPPGDLQRSPPGAELCATSSAGFAWAPGSRLVLPTHIAVWVGAAFCIGIACLSMCAGLGCPAHIVIWVLQGSCLRRPPALVCSDGPAASSGLCRCMP